MTSRVAVPLFCLLIWAAILAWSDPIIPTNHAESSFNAGGKAAHRHHDGSGPVSPSPRTSRLISSNPGESH